MLKTGEVTEISLDHDLGNDDHGTGYDVVLWIEEQTLKTSIILFKGITSHRWLKFISIANVN
ncbi:cyclic-phosphate processing receiver domain-containing protein [Agarivorans sp. QJM3NY_25]|uniref:cyclic-phosphate processing receiver domain-containing protein n=1 Tax=Agarivorans sp. QJM3NY_25 TaxID=3421430 RepID=UPI003F6A5D06